MNQHLTTCVFFLTVVYVRRGWPVRELVFVTSGHELDIRVCDKLKKCILGRNERAELPRGFCIDAEGWYC